MNAKGNIQALLQTVIRVWLRKVVTCWAAFAMNNPSADGRRPEPQFGVRRAASNAKRFSTFVFIRVHSRFVPVLIFLCFVRSGAGNTNAYFEHEHDGRYYVEERWDGRIYVIGRPATYARFTASREMPDAVTLVGAGPEGETVIVEADTADPGMVARLRARFEESHSAAASAPNAVDVSYPAERWRDIRFKEQFIGTYAFTAAVEPPVSDAERTVLVSILGLMEKDDLDGALATVTTLFQPPPPVPAAATGAKGSAPAATAPPAITNPSAIFMFIAGNIQFQKGDLEESARWYTRAIETFPSFLRAHQNLGLLDVRRGQYETAIRSLTKAIELGANGGLLYGLLGYAYSSTGNHLAAESGLRQAIMLQPDNLDWKLGLARALFGQQRFAETASLCDRLIAGDSSNATFWQLQANAYLGLNMPLKAAQNYEFLRLQGHADVDTLYRLGDIYVKERMMDAAVKTYVAALAAANQPPDRPLRCATQLAMNGALVEAKELIVKIDEQYAPTLTDKQRADLLRLQARIAMMEGVDDRQAELLKKIVEIDPTDGEALISLGQYYARTQQPDMAIFYFERADGIAAVEAKAKIRHAQVLVEQAKYQDAIPLLKSALRIEHRDDVAAYLEQVEAAAKSRQ